MGGLTMNKCFVRHSDTTVRQLDTTLGQSSPPTQPSQQTSATPRFASNPPSAGNEVLCCVCGLTVRQLKDIDAGTIDNHHIVYPSEGKEMTVPLCRFHHCNQPGRDSTPFLRMLALEQTIERFNSHKNPRMYDYCEICDEPIRPNDHVFELCFDCYSYMYNLDKKSSEDLVFHKYLHALKSLKDDYQQVVF